MKIEIKSRFTGTVLFVVEGRSLKVALEVVVGQRANLGDVDLGGADLRDVDLILAYRSDGYAFVATPAGNDQVRLFAGCRTFSLVEAREHWMRTRGGTMLGDESLALVDHIERVAKIHGWLGGAA